MSIITHTPTDKNFLSPLGFKFEIKRLSHFNYFIQAVDFPGMNIGDSGYSTPFSKLSIAGDHAKFQDLVVTFKIGEDLYSYTEIYDWMTGLGKPESFDQYKTLESGLPGSGKELYSDATLILLNGTMNPNVVFTFYDVYPKSLSGFNLDSRNSDVNYVTATATFNYREFVYSRTV